MPGTPDKQTLLEKANIRLNEFKAFQKEGLIPLHGDFFASGVHFPPITMYEPTGQDIIYKDYTPPADNKFDIYIHIPFCIKRCLFCHYPSLYRATDAAKDEYLDALEKEMEIFMRLLDIKTIKARSILIGGGTPTDLTPKQLQRFLGFFTSKVDISECRQFNYDVDPETLIGPVGLERLKIIKDFGGDRLTIGVQSLIDEVLKRMNRSHNAAVAIESVENCKKFGYKLNIEFIFGHPGQTIDNWIDVMNQAVGLDVPEIQLYRLKVEPYGDQVGSIKNFRRYHPDELPKPEEAILMKQIAIDLLRENGYTENLRRVFTRKRSDISLYAFNQCCQLLDEVGFGLTAFSSLHDRFILNTQHFDHYYDSISKGHLPMNRGIMRNPEQQMRWSLILPLKNYYIRKKRLDEVNHSMPIPESLRDRLDTLKRYDLVVEDDNRIELTTKGAFFADEVVQQLYDTVYIPFPSSDYNAGPLNPYRARKP